MGPQSHGSPNCGNFGTPIWESWDNAIWMWPLWRGAKNTIRGKVVGSPKSGPWWILWVQGCPWLVLTPKVPKLCINQLVVWFVQIHVSDWTLIILPNPIPELQHTLLPLKCCEPRSVPDSLFFRCFHFKLSIESIKELGNASTQLGCTSKQHKHHEPLPCTHL
jgi:hypothetical protein